MQSLLTLIFLKLRECPYSINDIDFRVGPKWFKKSIHNLMQCVIFRKKIQISETESCTIWKFHNLNYLINEYSCNVELLALVKARSSTLQSNKRYRIRVLVYYVVESKQTKLTLMKHAKLLCMITFWRGTQ